MIERDAIKDNWHRHAVSDIVNHSQKAQAYVLRQEYIRQY